ncbi:MATE family efflux transporter [Psychroserpens sp.]|uniref:MATE family efflux transporter n=1 Tax=Psychroserpens sp. TaxID=2020870 RepID=UPI001B08AA90|nr:MATE family efflux transporter [Psychroserpens sp.]MBO6605470.1 MATE family efflux transporter [Psychroserpens sp.]MBO6630376.1 MATE family efflux transporter [Psychroserpens sp.]MBO6653721.1 MATE family efflux transporter [Psychroserpens sp.]MBO6682042.1 MATE family efflux transporter [Psychroserpens sp.]MBO6748844.1 MATE family efflux transporter [Psychroserpens sp.]
MAKTNTKDLGTQPIGKLLIKQAVPASIGILVMSLNILVDTIFVGQWIGATAIAAINVVLPVSFFIAALGMSIGIGGSSIISRALGANNEAKAFQTFGNQITLTLLFTISMVIPGLIFVDSIIPAFGGKGAIFDPAKIYYTIVLYGVPFLALCMMGNTVIRAEGKPKFAMYAMMIPSVGNLVLDYVFINLLDFGMEGAAWATTGSYILCLAYIIWFFLSSRSELKLTKCQFRLRLPIVKEIGALGFVTLARQAVVSITYLFMNNILFDLGGETSVTAYAIVGRMLMFALFPVYGITQGFLPIAGYNYGAEQYERVRYTIETALKYAIGLATVVFIMLMIFPESITRLFTDDAAVIRETPSAMRWVFAATPIIAVQLIGAAYFQAIGKATPALLLTLTRQGIFFIPLIFILPKFYGELGVWMSFPISDILSTIVTAFFLHREVKLKLLPAST